MILGVCVCARARGRARVRVRVFVCYACVVNVLHVCVRVFFTRARARVCVARACGVTHTDELLHPFTLYAF